MNTNNKNTENEQSNIHIIVCSCKKCGNIWETPKSVFSHGIPKCLYENANKAIYDGCFKCTDGAVTFNFK